MNRQVAMHRIHIVGRKNSGKTTLVCELIQEFVRRGLRVASIKHTHHQHELDTPGKDSWQHREAGAAAVGICSAGMTALFIPTDRDAQLAGGNDKYAMFDHTLRDFDLVLVEGDLQTDSPRIEVWRSASGEPPLAASDSGIRTLVTDDECGQVRCDLIARKSVSAIADAVLQIRDQK
jgi:molybdopterin-guanine dinucleotide biosynthesis adapter protein